MRRAAAATLLVALALLVPGAAHAKEKLPAFTAPVVDTAGVVPDDVERQVGAALTDYQTRSNNQVAVAVVKTTGDQSLEDYTIDLARKWGVGTKDKDNGVLLLIAHGDRKLRIEVGRGLEGDLTDLESGRIIRERIVPRLRENNVGGAVVDGTLAIRSTLGDPQVGELPPPPPEPTEEQQPENSFGWFIPVAIGGFALMSAIGRRRGRRGGWGWMPVYWGGGGFGGGGGGFSGGGFGGGGGGGFGGGGASGSW